MQEDCKFGWYLKADSLDCVQFSGEPIFGMIWVPRGKFEKFRSRSFGSFESRTQKNAIKRRFRQVRAGVLLHSCSIEATLPWHRTRATTLHTHASKTSGSSMTTIGEVGPPISVKHEEETLKWKAFRSSYLNVFRYCVPLTENFARN